MSLLFSLPATSGRYIYGGLEFDVMFRVRKDINLHVYHTSKSLGTCHNRFDAVSHIDSHCFESDRSYSKFSKTDDMFIYLLFFQMFLFIGGLMG